MSYTQSGAQSGNLTIFAINTGTVSTPIYTPIYDLEDVAQSGKTNKTADVTNISSADEEFIVTISNNGKFSLTLNRNSSDPGQQALVSAFNSKALTLFKVTLQKNAAQTATGDSFVFNALVDSLDDLSSMSSTKQIIAKASLTVSGAITFTAGS